MPSLATVSPTETPTVEPTDSPTDIPSASPSVVPTITPTYLPSETPSHTPSITPTDEPTAIPTGVPTQSPTLLPTELPSLSPTPAPTDAPSEVPTVFPTHSPTDFPSFSPSSTPTNSPSVEPTVAPTTIPTTVLPTEVPTYLPSFIPSVIPTPAPTFFPTILSTTTTIPTLIPSSKSPSRSPTYRPTRIPTAIRSHHPTSVNSTTLTIFPEENDEENSYRRFQGNLFSFGSVAPLLIGKGIPEIDLSENPLSSSSTHVIFGRRNKQQLKNIVIGSPQSQVAYSTVNDHTDNTDTDISSSLLNDVVSRSITFVGDLNNDGSEDLILGDPVHSICFVYFGTTGQGRRSFNQAAVSFTITGDETNNDYFGWAISKGGDINHDGFDDLVISAKNSGVIYVIYGHPSVLLLGQSISALHLEGWDGFKIIGSSHWFITGLAVTVLNDFNGDGTADIVISSITDRQVYVTTVLFLDPTTGEQGGGGSLSDISVDDYPRNVTFIGPGLAITGFSIAGLGDINQDGVEDLAIGSIPYRGGYQEQMTFVVYGKKKDNNNNDWEKKNSLLLSNLEEGEDGFTIRGGGFMVAGPGDVNEDGLNDILVTSYYEWQTNPRNAYLLVFPKYVSESPTVFPSSSPSSSPTAFPTHSPTIVLPPTNHPSLNYPSSSPSFLPTLFTSSFPTSSSTTEEVPVVETAKPSFQKTVSPSFPLTSRPTIGKPSLRPTKPPSRSPTVSPSMKPSLLPTRIPTFFLTRFLPSFTPSTTARPSFRPTSNNSENNNNNDNNNRSPTTFPTNSAGLPSFLSSVNSSFEIVTFTDSGKYELSEGNQMIIISDEVEGTIRIHSSPNTNNNNNNNNGARGRRGRKIYVFLKASHQKVIIDYFDPLTDLLDISHIRGLTSLLQISYVTFPLTVYLSSTQMIVFSNQNTMNLQESNFLFSTVSTDSSPPLFYTSNRVFLGLMVMISFCFIMAIGYVTTSEGEQDPVEEYLEKMSKIEKEEQEEEEKERQEDEERNKKVVAPIRVNPASPAHGETAKVNDKVISKQIENKSKVVHNSKAVEIKTTKPPVVAKAKTASTPVVRNSLPSPAPHRPLPKKDNHSSSSSDASKSSSSASSSGHNSEEDLPPRKKEYKKPVQQSKTKKKSVAVSSSASNSSAFGSFNDESFNSQLMEESFDEIDV
jgi:hypothetical protein